MEDSVCNLKNNIKEVWEKTRRTPKSNIKRGHTRSLSTDVEDYVTVFISDILDDRFEFYIDSSVHIQKTHRPDLLIVKDSEVVALVEIKSQMGWCRDVSGVIDSEIIRMHNAFTEIGDIICKFSIDGSCKKVHYGNNVKLFLISLTSKNGGDSEQLAINMEYAKYKGVSFRILFDGWYDNLRDRDICIFSEEISELNNLM